MDPDGPLYLKFLVERIDGTDQPGCKHECCKYFVLDLDHDPHASPALRAYAASCEATHPLLAAELRQQATNIDNVMARRQAGR